MKKTWVALALAGAFAAGAAQAQSSVTLYGILDVNYRWLEAPVAGKQESRSGIDGGHQSGNRWGLRGSEDLGGGWKAIFALESGFSIDTGAMGNSNSTTAQGAAAPGTAGGRLFGRQAYAGLSGGWGDVVAGRLASFSSGTGDFDMFGRTDPFSTGFGLANMGNTFYSAAALRVDNAIAYRTPMFGGFRGGIGYSFNINGGETAPDGSNVSALFTGVNWTGGPLWVGLTYDVIYTADATATTPARPDQKHMQLGGTFDLGPVRLHAGYAMQDDIGAVLQPSGVGSGQPIVLPAGATFDADSYILGVTWTVGAFKVMGSYQALDADGKTLGTGANRVNFEPDYSIWALGGTYNLSRRTNLYASYASRDADGTLTGNSFNSKEFALGVRHLF